jgi:hypothetical protein
MSAPLHGSHVTVIKTSRFGLGDLHFDQNGDPVRASSRS